MTIFRFFEMAAIHILDLLYAFLDHPRRVFAGTCHCAKFSWIRCSYFDNMQVLILGALGLKCPFTTPNSGALSTRPQVERPCAETRHIAYTTLKSIHGCKLNAANSDSHAFQWDVQPTKLPLPFGGSHPQIIHGSLGSADVAP